MMVTLLLAVLIGKFLAHVVRVFVIPWYVGAAPRVLQGTDLDRWLELCSANGASESWAVKISGLSEPVHLKALPSVPCNITGGSWQQGPSMPYPYHWDHAALMAQGKIYAVGGYIGSEGRAMDQIRAFDPDTREWSDLSPLPEGRHHVMASVYPSPANDGIVILGGIDG